MRQIPMVAFLSACLCLGTSLHAQTAVPWAQGGNAISDPNSQYFGTNNYQDLYLRVNGQNAGWLNLANWNTAWGIGTLNPGYVTGYWNTAVGALALGFDNGGSYNTAVGTKAMWNNGTGNDNTAVGQSALGSNSTGADNTAVGGAALAGNIGGSSNVAVGARSLASNMNGGNNTATGQASLVFNSNGSNNTATGSGALYSNGYGNTADNVSSNNTADGASALSANQTGNGNTAVGANSLNGNTTGNFNTAVGYGADVADRGYTNATAIGAFAQAGASNTVILGGTGSNAVNVGIGTATPSAALEVNSNVSGLSGLKLTGLTSSSQTVAVQPIGVDANGNVVAVTGGASGSFLPLSGGTLTGGLNINVNNTWGGSGSSINFINPSIYGQIVQNAYVNNNVLVGRTRFDYFGNAYWIAAANSSGWGHNFLVGGDQGPGMTKMKITSTGVVMGPEVGAMAPKYDMDVRGAMASTGPAFLATVTGNVGIGTSTPASKLHIGAGNGDGLLIGNYNDQLGWNGEDPQPGYSIRFAGYRDIVDSMTGAKISALRTNRPSYPGYATGMDLVFYTQGFGQNQRGDLSLVEAMRIKDSGYIGIGTASPQARLEIKSGPEGGSGLRLTNLKSPSAGSVLSIGVDASGMVVASGNVSQLSGNYLPLTGGVLSGSLLIGKNSSNIGTNYKLDVAGNIRADKLTVNTTGADFVFDSSYHLLPLGDVESYVKENRHLPGIAPADEMQKDGVEVGESQTKLLQKIEELTLYMIEMKKESERQQQEIEGLKKQLAKQKK